MVVPVLALILAGQAPGPKPVAAATRSLSNVKQIGLAVMMYSADHGDTLPSAKGMKAAVMPYIKNPALFTAPGALKGTQSYFMETRLSGMKLSAIQSLSETAMIVEGRDGKVAFPYHGRTAIAFVDGHAKLVTAKAAAKARTLSLQ